MLASAEFDVSSTVGESGTTMSTSPSPSTAAAASSGVDVRRGRTRRVAASAGGSAPLLRVSLALASWIARAFRGGMLGVHLRRALNSRAYVVAESAFNRCEIHATHSRGA
jgi:hypothetical protein